VSRGQRRPARSSSPTLSAAPGVQLKAPAGKDVAPAGRFAAEKVSASPSGFGTFHFAGIGSQLCPESVRYSEENLKQVGAMRNHRGRGTTKRKLRATSLYARPGGYDAIVAVVDDLLERLQKDPLLKRARRSTWAGT
jgi:hypothetical protein